MKSVKLEDKIQVENDLAELPFEKIKSLDEELKDIADISVDELVKELSEKASSRTIKRKKPPTLHPVLEADEFETTCEYIKFKLIEANSDFDFGTPGTHHIVWLMRLIDAIGYRINKGLLANPNIYDGTIGSVASAGFTEPLCQEVLRYALLYYKDNRRPFAERTLTLESNPPNKSAIDESDNSTADPRWGSW